MQLTFDNMTLELKSVEEKEQELMKISEAVDEELTASVTPPAPLIPSAPPEGKVLKTEKQKLNFAAAHLTADIEGLLLLDPP